MRENFSFTVKKIADDMKLVLAYWFYGLVSGTEDLGEKSSVQFLFMELVNSMGLGGHLKKVLDAFIKRHIKLGLLHVDPEVEDKNFYRLYDSQKKYDVYYLEEEEIAAHADSWCSVSEIDLNLIRAVFASRENCFSEIVFCTFFCEPSSGESFRIPRNINKANNRKLAKYDSLSKNTEQVKVISDAFGLDKEESILLNFGYMLAETREFNKLRRDFTVMELVENCLGFSQKQIRKNFVANGKLISFGLMEEEGSMSENVIDAIYSNDLEVLFSDLIKKDDSKKEIFNLESFPVDASEGQLALRLLNSDSSVNILLHGAAGSGKTQFARSLIRATGKKLVFFDNEMEISKNGVLDAVKQLNAYLSLPHPDSILVVDEAENVLATMNQSFFGMCVEHDKKAVVNKMLENSNSSVLWIVNYKNALDESTLRRINYDIAFKPMSNTMIKQIADSKLKKLHVSDELHTSLVELCGKFKVTGASVDNVIKTVKGMDLSNANDRKVLEDVKSVLKSNSTLVYGESKMRDYVCKSYDLSVLNSTVAAEKIVSMVQNANRYAEENGETGRDNGIRILFYGASGTGKTELARYIAEKLDKKLLLKRASDIFGMYVGQNEQNIRKAFEEATESDSILLFDEADSFFANRSLAQNSWERTTVNEFLTQMEEFPGILICTTNLKKIMDPAMERRFHIKSEFRPLTFEGIGKLLKKYFRKLDFTDRQIERIADYDSATPGDFGALAGRIRFMDPGDVTSDFIVNELCEAQKSKDTKIERKMGFAC